MRALYYDANDEQQGECENFLHRHCCYFYYRYWCIGIYSMATPTGSSGNSTIGVIDTSRMMSQDNPIYISAAQEYMSYQSQLQQETQAKIDAAQDDATKQKLAEEARQNLAKKDQEIAKSVQDKAMEAAKAVGDAKGLSVVMTKDTVLYGGVDITDQVLKKLANDAKK